jgi:fluoride exporter
MKLLIQYLVIGAAGSAGAMLRFFVATVCGRLFGTAFPYGTFIINITGSLFLGWFLTAIQERVDVSDTTRLAVAVGFVGAYTTFSTFAFESNRLLEDGSGIKAMVNILGSLLAGLVAVRLGVALASR